MTENVLKSSHRADSGAIDTSDKEGDHKPYYSDAKTICNHRRNDLDFLGETEGRMDSKTDSEIEHGTDKKNDGEDYAYYPELFHG